MPNYLTPEGAKKYAEELNKLLSVDRPRVVQEVADAAAQGDRSENAEYTYGKKRLREIDRRVRFLTKRLDAAVVVRTEEVQKIDEVRFGASVEVVDENGKKSRYQVVGFSGVYSQVLKNESRSCPEICSDRSMNC